MKDRRCVMLLFYDVPMQKRSERRNYARFRAALKKIGFLAMQESVYVKLLRNRSLAAETIKEATASAPDGNISVLTLPLSEFRQLRALRGTPFNMAAFSDDILYL